MFLGDSGGPMALAIEYLNLGSAKYNNEVKWQKALKGLNVYDELNKIPVSAFDVSAYDQRTNIGAYLTGAPYMMSDNLDTNIAQRCCNTSTGNISVDNP